MVDNLLIVLRGHRINLEEDLVFWKEGRNGQFRVKKAYSLLASPIAAGFLLFNSIHYIYIYVYVYTSFNISHFIE